MKNCPNCGYQLIGDAKAPQNRSKEAVATKKDNIIEAYLPKSSVKEAKPKVYGYRERYKKGKLMLKDIKAERKVISLPKTDGEMDKFGGLVFGKGIEQVI